MVLYDIVSKSGTGGSQREGRGDRGAYRDPGLGDGDAAVLCEPRAPSIRTSQWMVLGEPGQATACEQMRDLGAVAPLGRREDNVQSVPHGSPAARLPPGSQAQGTAEHSPGSAWHGALSSPVFFTCLSPSPHPLPCFY